MTTRSPRNPVPRIDRMMGRIIGVSLHGFLLVLVLEAGCSSAGRQHPPTLTKASTAQLKPILSESAQDYVRSHYKSMLVGSTLTTTDYILPARLLLVIQQGKINVPQLEKLAAEDNGTSWIASGCLQIINAGRIQIGATIIDPTSGIHFTQVTAFRNGMTR